MLISHSCRWPQSKHFLCEKMKCNIPLRKYYHVKIDHFEVERSLIHLEWNESELKFGRWYEICQNTPEEIFSFLLRNEKNVKLSLIRSDGSKIWLMKSDCLNVLTDGWLARSCWIYTANKYLVTENYIRPSI